MDATVGESVDVVLRLDPIAFREALEASAVAIVGFVSTGAGDRLLVTGSDVAIETVEGAEETILKLAVCLFLEC